MNSLRKREADAPSPFHGPGGNAVPEIALYDPKVIAAASCNTLSCRQVEGAPSGFHITSRPNSNVMHPP